MRKLALCTLAVMLALGSLFSCKGLMGGNVSVVSDSLNALSYTYHYKNLDSCRDLALRALRLAGNDPVAVAQAYNNLAFYAFMQMDFEQSRKYEDLVYASCNNELELLVADVGMMKICQRTSANKRFYDYRNSALSRLKRMDESQTASFSREERRRLAFARSEFHIVSSIYFYYLQQLPQSLTEIEEVNPNIIARDTAQGLYYYYMRGSGGLCPGTSAEDITLHEFDYLSKCIAEAGDYIYFEANCLQAFAEALNDPHKMEIVKAGHPHILKMINTASLPDSLLPLHLARSALSLFKLYGDVYQIAGAYRTIGSCLIQQKHYAEAVDTLQRALDYVSSHHSRYYACADTVHRLQAYPTPDTLQLELGWMRNNHIQTVPEWIARIREQLSIAYAGLGKKRESDYNRNVYLDILDVTRQDKELESRYDRLEQESAQLSYWLTLSLVVLLLALLLFMVLNSRWRKNNERQIFKLKQTLDFCRELLSAIPLEVEEEGDVCQAVTQCITPHFEELFGCKVTVEEKDNDIELKTDRHLSKDERALVEVIHPYVGWAVRCTCYFSALGGERKQLEAEKYSYEQHIIENKKLNEAKKACVSIATGITPYLDRILNEVHKLLGKGYKDDEALKTEKLQYIHELVTRINEYNDILALWIKMRQGTLSLHIQTFSLNDLFSIISKSRKAFENKHQTLEVKPTTCMVKADKALTLFMINTLADNARKYTPEGGRIEVSAKETDQYVEVSVSDTGRGLSPEDVNRILHEKVYDSGRIGMKDGEMDENLRRSKGSGFGLMNCRGIIEKYRKASPQFQVCLFSVESQPGKGSRFFFRLPKGVGRALVALLLCMAGSVGLSSCKQASAQILSAGIGEDSSYYDRYLDRASRFADSTYYANVYRCHEQALAYADSAIYYLNRHFMASSHCFQPLMTLTGEGEAVEVEWHNSGFETDYHVILDIRNEAAVAFLALKDWKGYYYNNAAYTYLYKMLSRDTRLEEYCREMEHSADNKTVSIILCISVLFLFLLGYYLLYFRHKMLYRYNLEQLLNVNKLLLDSSETFMQGEQDWKGLWNDSLAKAFDGLNDLVEIHAWGIAVYQQDLHKLETVCYPHTSHIQRADWWVERCYHTQSRQVSDDGTVCCFPLTGEWEAEERCLGVFVVCPLRKLNAAELLLMDMLSRYIGILVMNNIVRTGNTYRDLELLRDDMLRARHEENILHVQNMVLDNCLSTIKHETLYYPNRIQQIVERMLAGLPREEEEAQMKAMEELTTYYKEVFTLLCSCAARQMEEVTFRRQSIAVSMLMDSAVKYAKRLARKNSFELDLQVKHQGGEVIGDAVLLSFLLENLLQEAYTFAAGGQLKLEACTDGDFMRFTFTDYRRSYTQAELNDLFYPNLQRMGGGEDGKLKGTEYLICKQIIRDHDEYAGHRGCRINAEALAEGGFSVWFTVPVKKNK